jgi:hypothetical protein
VDTGATTHMAVSKELLLTREEWAAHEERSSGNGDDKKHRGKTSEKNDEPLGKDQCRR